MPEQKKKVTSDIPLKLKVRKYLMSLTHLNREAIARISLNNTLIILQEMKVRAFYLIIVVFGIKGFI